MNGATNRSQRALAVNRRNLLAATGAGAGLLSLGQFPAGFTKLAAQESSELRFGVSSDPVSMDPRVNPVTIGFSILRHVYEPLAFRNAEMETVPVLAESWERLDDLTWEFKLRQSVKFHNGEDFTAESVKYTIESLLSNDNAWVNPQFGGYIAVIEEVEIVDDHTVRLHTTTPSNALVNNLTLIGMLPPVAASEAGENFTNVAAGTGPFRLVDYVSNSNIDLEVFDEYWGEAPGSSRLNFRILPEDATRLAALESGEVHIINNLPIDAVTRFEESDELQVLSRPSNRIIFIGWWNDQEPFTDIRVRQAFNHALDKETIIAALFNGRAEIATGPIHPSIRGFAEGLQPYEYNPDLARELLAEAGFGDGLEITFGYPTGRYLMDRQVGEAVAGMLSEVGINVTPETAEWGTFFNNRGEGQYDAWLYGFGANTMDPDFALQWFWRAPAAGGNYENPEVSELLAEADAVTDIGSSTELYQQAVQIIWQDAPWGFLYYQPDVFGASAQLQGFEPRIDEYFLLFDATVAT